MSKQPGSDEHHASTFQDLYQRTDGEQQNYMFVGLNGGTADELGFKIVNANFGLGVFVQVDNPKNFWVGSDFIWGYEL